MEVEEGGGRVLDLFLKMHPLNMVTITPSEHDTIATEMLIPTSAGISIPTIVGISEDAWLVTEKW